MMSPLSWPVLIGSAVVSSPALWAGMVEGTMPLDVALTRFLIALAASWVAISLAAELAFPDARQRAAQQNELTAPARTDAGHPDRANPVSPLDRPAAESPQDAAGPSAPTSADQPADLG